MGGKITGIGKKYWRLALIWLVFLPASLPAYGDVTVADLAAPAVTGVGPHFQDLDDAIKAFAAGDPSTAMTRLESAKKSTPRLAPPEIMMARLYISTDNLAPAIGLLEKVARTNPEDPEALVMLAEAALAGGRYTEAALLFEKAAPVVEEFRVNTKRQEDLRRRFLSGAMRVAEVNANWPLLQRLGAQLILIEPNNSSALEKLGRALFRQNKGEEAYKEFQKAAAADPKQPPAELAMANLFTDKENAEKWISHALERSGNDIRTQLAVGNFRFRGNRLGEAKQHADKALQIDPNSMDANLLAGVVARFQEDYPTAIKHLSAAHLLAPADTAIVNFLALSLAESPDEKDRQRAVQFAELNLRLNPTGTEQLATYGWTCFKVGRRGDAERTISAALKATMAAQNNMIGPEMGYYLASLAIDNGKVSNATTWLKNALNTTGPYPYRKAAQELLVKAEKIAATQNAAAKSGPAATPGASPAAKSATGTVTPAGARSTATPGTP
jgi:tetratricopeptide (TPR) repeat protein